ncbi:MAG: hypothetical protein V2A76_07460 [Planctomycetota bacterium]
MSLQQISRLTLLAWCALWSASTAGAAVPPPSETPVDIVVSGRTSTLLGITIVNVGQEVPRTYAGDQIKSVPGTTWYVSRHYALRSEMSESESREYLTLSELAYPHLVWVIGKEPPDIDTTRIALSYSKSLERLKEASDIDLGGVGWRGGGGG